MKMRSVFNDVAYADVQKQLLQQVTSLRTEFKEPEKDDPRAYGGKPQK